MARKRANPPPKKPAPKGAWVATAVFVLLAAVVLFAVLADDDASPTTQTGACVPVDSFPDIHGLAVAPDDPSLLYVATHHGLIRATNDTAWCRVGPVADYMGFTMHPTSGNTFWVSGHPSSGGNMGVRQSTDGGHTWETLALEGVDFHAMTVSRAEPLRLWGMYQGEVYRSLDAGNTWSTIGRSPAGFTALESHPLDPAIVYGISQTGIHASGDAGMNWILAHDRPTFAFAVHPQDADLLVAVFDEGLHRSEGNAVQWDPLPLETDDTVRHLAFSPSEPDTLYAATVQGAIHKSVDGGDSWTRLR